MSKKGPIKVSGLVGAGRVVPRPGVARSDAFDQPAGKQEAEQTPAAQEAGNAPVAPSPTPMSTADVTPAAPVAAPAVSAGVASSLQPAAASSGVASTATADAVSPLPENVPSDMMKLPGQGLVPRALVEIEWKLVTDWSPFWNREVYIPLSLLVDSPFQAKKQAGARYSESELMALGAAMTEGRQEEAIQVRWVHGRFEAIAGHRRSRGAAFSDWKYIRAIIRNYSDRDAQLALFTSNSGRIDDYDYNLAKNYHGLATHPDPQWRKSQRQIAALFFAMVATMISPSSLRKRFW